MPFNIALLNEKIAEAIPDREAIVFRNKRFTHAELAARSRCLARFLLDNGVSIKQERDQLQNWESGQDHVAIYLYNGNEYVESILGTLKARACPINVNFRYVAEELSYLLENSETKAIIYQACFAPVVKELISSSKKLSRLKTLIQVQDGSNQPLVPGAVDYEAVLKAELNRPVQQHYSIDDAYILYTGGTTGMPKGVIWRQADVLSTILGGNKSDAPHLKSMDAMVARAVRSKGLKYLITPPFMHGTAQWNALAALLGGNTVVIQNNVRSLDPQDLLTLIENEKINILSIVGNAFGQPLLEELRMNSYDLSSVTHILNSGAALSAVAKSKLLRYAENAKIMDTIGASETGPQAINISTSDNDSNSSQYRVMADNVVLNEDKTHVLPPGRSESGWLAKTSNVPLGYLNDEKKTCETFPTIDGVRYSLPGDRVTQLENGEIEFQGRDSTTINSGGEKIFAEEVEQAIRSHSQVVDVVVSSRPSERWGQEVVAIVQLDPYSDVSQRELLAEGERHIAKYKLPKNIIYVNKVERGPNGKVDHTWAKELATNSQEQTL